MQGYMNMAAVVEESSSSCNKWKKWGFPGGSRSKESACNAGDLSLIPGSVRSPGEGMATYSSILAWRIPMDRGAWWVPIHGVAKNWT